MRSQRLSRVPHSARLLAAAVLLLAAVTAACDSAADTAPGVFPGATGDSAPTSSYRVDRSWIQDFAGPTGNAPDPSLLAPYPSDNGNGNHELEAYTVSGRNFGLDGAGHLLIVARREHHDGNDGHPREWTSARLTSLDHWAFTHGTLSARLEVPSARGLWPAFWLLGADIGKVGWPAAGEIDVMESVGTNAIAYQSLHGPTSAGSPWALTQHTRLVSPTAYHVYSVTRTSRRITFAVDGRVTRTITSGDLSAGRRWVFERPMFFLLNLAVGGDWPGAPDGTTPAVTTMSIDWVKYSP